MPASTDPMRGPRLKIDRANAHIIEANAAVVAYVQDDPTLVETYTEPDSDGAHKLYKVRLTKCVPETLIPIVGDVVGNLRSALDHVTVQLAIQKNKAASTKGISYPFARTVEKFKGPETKKKIERLTPEAQDFLLGLETYEGGKGEALWALNELRQLDFHNGLVPIASLAMGVSSRWQLQPVVGRNVIEAPKWARFDEDMSMTVLRLPIGTSNVEGQGELRLQVAFGNVELFEGEAVIPVLEHLSNLTAHVVTLVEDHFFKP